MKVKSQYLGKLRDFAGVREETVTIDDGSPLIVFMEKLAETHGDAFGFHQIRKNSYVILVNGIHYETLDAEKTILQEGDTVVFLPVTMGG